MLATRIRQKEGTFYFIAYKAADLLEKVRFTSRYYFEGEEIAQSRIAEHDEVAQFIAGIERSEKGFQRVLNRQKIKQIVNFYETVVAQPMIPGTVLLFTDETLRFQPVGGSESIGHLSESKGKYLVIDGQHRLAGLHFFQAKHPDQSSQVEVPCLLFDGRSGDFATEMFVIINSTHTRINRSHLVDLYEKVSWESPEKKFTAKVVNLLYSEEDSPLRYKINRLGGRSKQEKWVLQSEVFNELLKVVTAHKRWIESHLGMKADRCYALVRDYLKGVKEVMVEVWGHNERYMFTRDVTLKALIRVLDDLIIDRKLIKDWDEQHSHRPFTEIVKPWAPLAKEFRAEGFYERFPAKGQLERVRKVHQRLLDAITG
ncbi:MAG: DGQHR domain-containing protein [Nitrospira sp.]|nr:DGQHR domain-containing protein [Nitrospira sp.]